MLVGLSLLSCSSDNENKVGGEVVINGESYELKKGIIVISNDQKTFHILLANGEVFYDPNRSYKEGPYYFSDNTTQYIDFEMHGAIGNAGNIESAIYSFPNDKPNFDYNTPYMHYVGVYTNLITINGIVSSFEWLNSDNMTGQAELTKVGDAYKITFSYGNQQNAVSGTYSGPLNRVEN